MNKLSFLLSFLFSLYLIFPDSVLAQDVSLGVAVTVDTQGLNVEEGDLICSGESGFSLCSSPYDTSINGVITNNPASSIENLSVANPAFLLSSGTSKVKVSSVNGNIAVGDFITSSEREGVGQLADQSGYVVGMSLEDYSSDNPDEIELILVSLNIHPAASSAGPRTNLLQLFRQGLQAPVISPLDTMRYLLAIVIVFVSLVLGFVYFGRASGLGIQAIGRNPLASRKIQLAVFLHIFIMIIIVLFGFGLAYLVLVL